MADNPIISTSSWRSLLADGADNYAFYSPTPKAIVKAIYYKAEPGPDPVPDDYTISGGDFEIITDTRTLIKAEWSADLSKLPDAGKDVTVVIYNPPSLDNTWTFGTTSDVFSSIIGAFYFATITSTDTIGTIVKEADTDALNVIAAFLSTGGTLCMGCIQKDISATSETRFVSSSGMTLTLTFSTETTLETTQIEITQTDSSTVTQQIKKDETTFSLPGSQTSTIYHIVEECETFKKGNGIYLNSETSKRSKENDIGNLRFINRNSLIIILKNNTFYKVKYKIRVSGNWSNWSSVTHFKTRSKDYKRI